MGKRRRRHYDSTMRRVAMIKELTAQYYEPGNHLRSYKAVWRRWINPVYPMTYDTYLRLMQIDSVERLDTQTGHTGTSRQLTIFDVL